MSKLNEILKENTEVDKIINETFVMLYERIDVDGKNDMLLDLLKEYTHKNAKITEELKELRGQMYGL